MKILKGYVLVSEITKKANKTDPWLHEASYAQIEQLGTIPAVLKTSLLVKYQKLANQCHDLEFYYPYAELSRELGRDKDFIGVLDYQRKKKNKKPFDSIKIGGYKLFKLSDDFVELIKQGFTPYKLGAKFDKSDYKHIITMQDMKIGFY